MITLDDAPVAKSGERFEMSFSGLSTDTKPIETYGDGTKVRGIANGSTFMEMDTKKVYFYDEDADAWK